MIPRCSIRPVWHVQQTWVVCYVCCVWCMECAHKSALCMQMWVSFFIGFCYLHTFDCSCMWARANAHVWHCVCMSSRDACVRLLTLLPYNICLCLLVRISLQAWYVYHCHSYIFVALYMQLYLCSVLSSTIAYMYLCMFLPAYIHTHMHAKSHFCSYHTPVSVTVHASMPSVHVEVIKHTDM